MLNILLCLPEVPKTNYAFIADYYWPKLPIGIAYISASLKKAGFCVYTLNLNHETDTAYKILERAINEYDIAVIGCGDIVVNWASVKTVFDIAKQIKTDIITCVGGSIVTYSPIEAMAVIPSADFGVIGEGEITICELMRAIENKSDISEVDNIIYREKSGI